MPGLEDWVNQPLGIIQNIIDQNGVSDIEAIPKYFRDKLQSPNALSWIQSLNDTPLHLLRSNAFVRYRCMVQDMFGSECYLGLYEVTDVKTKQTYMKSGKYRDIAECHPHQEINVDSNKNVTLDRLTLYCIPVPGETDWVKKTYSIGSGSKSQPSTSRCQRAKRGREEAGEDTTEMEPDSAISANSNSNAAVAMDTDAVDSNKRTKTASDKASGLARSPNLNFPLPDESGTPCLIKMYDTVESYKVNDVVEFFGVLSVDPSLAELQGEEEAESIINPSIGIDPAERSVHAPPPSLVPRLHAILSHKLTHNNPHVTAEPTDMEAELQKLELKVADLRDHLVAVLEHALLGDRIAAEYLLCHLISSIYGRVDVMPLGKFSLNITKVPNTKDYAQKFYDLIASLVTKSHLLPMSLDNMNKMKFLPHKDYNENRLKTGLLQLSDNTHLIIDETAMQAGQLDANGVRNVTALGNLINWQKIEYDFNFHKQDFPSDVAIVILSEGKSLLPSDCLIPLDKKVTPTDLDAYFAAIDQQLTCDLLVKLRAYITCVQHLTFNMADEVQQAIQEDFVDARRNDPQNMTAEDFHTLLSLSRLMSLSYGLSKASLEVWNKAKHLESQRKSRLPSTENKS